MVVDQCSGTSGAVEVKYQKVIKQVQPVHGFNQLYIADIHQ
ncbi:hypothetical protein [Laceyella sacchari]|jgi:hypothetical protein|uniref:Uncharacterized protein n=1 Tax=Laceyella sacchari TaxID=37482 RepID=A0ABY5U6N0_LACSH|nr:hypothetical protein [Laceyella sacchari]UWE04280.1 hypothetical protein NYR52_03740 [Laceyella sacchari]